ncbi:MAG: DNA primase [Vulcanimicrobiota bacterium]
MNDFSRGDIQRMKSQADLVEVMRASGLELEPVGKNLICRCPWHDDKDASLVVNPEKQLYNCFGCDAKGDVLTFLQETEHLSFRAALERLAAIVGGPTDGESGSSACSNRTDKDETCCQQDPDLLVGGLTRPELLKRVAQHYAQGLAKSQEAQEYLRDRSLGDVEALRAFGVGYCDGSLLKTVPKGSDTRQALIDLGVLNSKGKEHFLGCVVVPLEDPELGIVGLYGRRINPKAKVKHLFLPGPKRGVLQTANFKAASSVFLTEGVLDALSLWVAGVRNVTCLYGTAGLTPDLLQALNGSNVRELWLCVDADRAGDESVERVTEQIKGRFALSRVLLPAGSDPNSILVNEGASVLRSLLDCRQPLTEPTHEAESLPGAGSSELPVTETTDTGFVLTFDEVVYQVTPRPPFTGRLQVTLRATVSGGTALRKRFLDRTDLSSARARGSTVKALSQSLSLPRAAVEAHMHHILDTAEHFIEAVDSETGDGLETEAPVLTEAQKLEALEFLQAPDLVRRLQDDMEAMGYVGEQRGKLLAYLIGLSRKLENPLSGIIRSQSGAGKSGLSSLVAKLTPPEEMIHYSRVSAHALAYAPKDAFKRKLIIMEERVGGESADYYIRILQSSHKIRQAVVIKDPATGKMRTQEFEVEGPIAYLETTTDRHLNQENASRCFEIYLDETEQQTRRIHERQRQARTLTRLKQADRKAIMERHHNAQRMLEELKVVIPYVDHLTFPTRWLRTRRDNERFLCLIEASAFLHQYQRVKRTCRRPGGEEVAYIEADLLHIHQLGDVLVHSPLGPAQSFTG